MQQDALSGPVFNGFAHVNGASHLPAMYDFRSSVLPGTSRCKGQPFPKHIPLPVGVAHFQRWLQLFYQPVDEHFSGTRTVEAKARALSIATLFEPRLSPRPALSVL
ncbi:hypothetical protein GCM10022408_06260 [Hymenobacter fastidiosus]|uniref:Uncharacterized protein n=1 Tax=Hymenobacter fastidiosus TaxID=486264 RepID=A0ABP7RJ39_9BACT